MSKYPKFVACPRCEGEGRGDYTPPAPGHEFDFNSPPSCPQCNGRGLQMTRVLLKSYFDLCTCSFLEFVDREALCNDQVVFIKTPSVLDGMTVTRNEVL